MTQARMRAVVVRAHGGPDALEFEDRPLLEPAADEVRVRVRAAGVNHLDVWLRRGVPGHKFPLPIVPGCDAAGEVDAVGSAARGVSPGDRVVAVPGVSCGRCDRCLEGEDHLCPEYGVLGEHRDGTYAEYVVLPQANVLPMPRGLSFEEAAAVPLVFLTAWHMVVGRAAVRRGETVLVQAAGSGVSSAAVQIARLRGARVIATAGSPEKCARAKALGADEALDHRRQDVVAELKRLAPGGVDVVVDHVGKDTFDLGLKALRKGGRYVFCGATSGAEVEVNLRRIFFKNLSVLGSTMGPRGELVEVLEHVGAGRLKPVLYRALPLSEAREAHALLESRAVVGKLVLVP